MGTWNIGKRSIGFEAIGFDLDETLVISHTTLGLGSLNAALALGMPKPKLPFEEIIQQLNPLTYREGVGLLKSNFGLSPNVIFEKFMLEAETQHIRILRKTPVKSLVVPGADSFLRHLDKTRKTCMVASNGRRQFVHAALHYSGLSKYIAPKNVIVPTTQFPEKPDKAIVLTVARRAGIGASRRVAFVGNSLPDQKAATAARMPFIGIIIDPAETDTAVAMQRQPDTIGVFKSFYCINPDRLRPEFPRVWNTLYSTAVPKAATANL
jgi:phosphoglycolate phosphatase-like HAD superfamily hydrolase